MTITDDVPRDTLLSYLDLQTDISDLINKYAPILGIPAVAYTLRSKSDEAAACWALPRPEPGGIPATQEETDMSDPDAKNEPESSEGRGPNSPVETAEVEPGQGREEAEEGGGEDEAEED